jgi:hypothetical protein
LENKPLPSDSTPCVNPKDQCAFSSKGTLTRTSPRAIRTRRAGRQNRTLQRLMPLNALLVLVLVLVLVLLT